MRRMNPACSRILLAVVCCMLCLPVACTPSKAHVEPFTIIVVPDTQNYADARTNEGGQRVIPDFSHLFFGQTQWIKDNKDTLNIAMVAHVGDIVQTNHPDEWKIADKAFRTLDGVVPYVLVPGNHDYGGDSRETLFNEYFPVSRFEGCPWYGGHFGDTGENSYALFEAGGMKFIILTLEFKPRDAALDWANSVVAEHADRRCIVVTHLWLELGHQIQNVGGALAGNSPPQVWEKFVSRHENIFLVLSGHLADCLLTGVGEHGNTVYQLQSDYQNWTNGGDGYLRMFVFSPEEDRISVRTYSTASNQFAAGSSALLELDYKMKATAP